MPKVKLKVVLAGGDCKTGKSSLLERIYRDTHNANYINTIGASVAEKKIGDAHLAIWDTSGAERFRSVTNGYLRTANAVIVTFDQSDAQSFTQAQAYMNTHLAIYLARDAVLVLCGNKSDLTAAVTQEEIAGFAKTWNEANPTHPIMKYFPVSAKTGDEVTNMFTEVTGMALSRVDPDLLVVHTEDTLKARFVEQYSAKLADDRLSWCGFYRFFANSRIEKDLDTMSLAAIIAHAASANNRSRQICIDLGWMNVHGRLHPEAPDVLHQLSNNKDNALLIQ